jgi:hypothetical protein
MESVEDATEAREGLAKADRGGERLFENVVEAEDQGAASAGDIGV